MASQAPTLAVRLVRDGVIVSTDISEPLLHEAIHSAHRSFEEIVEHLAAQGYVLTDIECRRPGDEGFDPFEWPEDEPEP